MKQMKGDSMGRIVKQAQIPPLTLRKYGCGAKQHKADDIPTIITPKGSAKPESVANLNACHLLRPIHNQRN